MSLHTLLWQTILCVRESRTNKTIAQVGCVGPLAHKGSAAHFIMNERQINGCIGPLAHKGSAAHFIMNERQTNGDRQEEEELPILC